MKIRFLDPEMGDNQTLVEPKQVADYIEENRSKIGICKWSDDEVLELMDRTGILKQLEEKQDQELTIYPLVSGG